MRQIGWEVEERLDWVALTEALAAGHDGPPAQVEDVFLYEGDNTLLNRSAWIAGLGIAVKCATIFPGNAAAGKPAIGGGVMLFSGQDGALEAMLDFGLVTKWKTAGDSLLAARRLARSDARRVLILGAGTVAASLIAAYSAGFPGASFTLWNRTRARAEALAADHPGVAVADDLATAVAEADIVCCATMSTEPVLRGEWLQPGQHVDLIGAYRPDMREADDAVLKRARIFVDSVKTTADHIGELKIPLAAGVITRSDIVADYSNLAAFRRESADEITLFKNGGGAHLDLMTSRYILEASR